MVGDNVNKVEINAHDGAQINIALGNGIVNAEQNNSYENSNNSPKNPIIFQNNKKQDYIKNWNSRMFLHVDNEENPITLADAFIMPDYKIYKSVKRIGYSDKDKLSVIIDKFIKYDRASSMLITGVPGAGKSTITSWISNKYMEDDSVVVLRFRDWDKEVLEKGILKAICTTLICKKEDLNNAILILDGFDEIKSLNNRQKLLDDFFNEINDFNTKYIITSRSSYIRLENFDNTITLLPFNIEKIEHFYKKITGIELKDKSIYNTEILGIPVILYMAIMSDIDISKEATKPELYSKIFAVKGGILDKFSYSGVGYDYGNQPLRDIKNMKIYLDFLQAIAFKMFDEDKLSLPRNEDEIQIPNLLFQGVEISILEFPIKILFENTISHIEFVHKSIYEYFVSEYIIQNIKKYIESDNYKEELACFFGKTLLHGKISYDINEFLKFKYSNSGLADAYNKIAVAFRLMLNDGMTYYAKKYYRNIIECELRVFTNMLEVIHLWENDLYKYDVSVVDYIRYNNKECLNLSKSDFKELNLTKTFQCKVNLNQSDLKYANLSNSDLRGLYLEGADLRWADLRYSDLRGTILLNSDLRNAKLQHANFRYARIEGAKFDEKQAYMVGSKYNLYGANVFTNDKQLIRYSEFKRKYER